MGTALTVFGLAGGYFLAKRGIGVGAQYIESRIGKPTLVRETSRASYKVHFSFVNLYYLAGVSKF